MGFDRRVLPKDRDREETYPWMSLLAIVVIVGGPLLLFWLAAPFIPDEPTESVLQLFML